MHRMTDMMPFIKPLLAFAGAGFCWVADVAASATDVLPGWVEKLGIPVAFCLISLYAVKALFQVNQTLHKEARETAEKQAEKTTAVNRELIEATRDQTVKLGELTEHLKSRPCQMPPTIFPRQKIDH